MNKKIYLNLLIVDFLKFLIPTTDNQTMVINDEKILNFN